MVLRGWGEVSKQVSKLSSHIHNMEKKRNFTLYGIWNYILSGLLHTQWKIAFFVTYSLSLCTHFLFRRTDRVLPSIPKGSQDLEHPIFTFTEGLKFLCQQFLTYSTQSAWERTPVRTFIYLTSQSVQRRGQRAYLENVALTPCWHYFWLLSGISCREKQCVIFWSYRY